ncbi:MULTISPECIES: hypothetical protein [Bacillus]|uniref:hypothetical protein n=1 Tax=Bacillus TaxID=1386 RepID=UPI000E4C4A39|nr:MULTISPECIES: hypothetical protein [Bacillus subtilis group]MBT3123279.1 hypothetical protein [Bacillus inaquosorum]MCB5337254.1 hypothetical protein [Bacillus amyloliquefaciens]MCF7615301.1 hypothetical protein [Bacillus subtilis]QWK35233.1 hypothetical protein KM843_20215 [Bacillus velezensis]RHL12221.1 hypothetical protein DW032_18435 [Bacillus licheniformis]
MNINDSDKTKEDCIKELADFYGLKYDPNKTELTIKNESGEVRVLKDSELGEVLGIPRVNN